jgi:Ca2+-binding RTX toxin-like protein
LGLKGFGAELFNVAGSTVLNTAFQNIRHFGIDKIWSNFNVADVFQGAPGALGGAFGAYFGAKLGAMVVSPTTQAGAVLSSVGSAVGSYAAVAAIGTIGTGYLAALGSVLIPGVGAFVGFVVGALIGNLFGRRKPLNPYAFAETVLQPPYAQFGLGSSGSGDGGNLDLAKSMAVAARDTLNGLIGLIVAGGEKGWVTNVDGQMTDQRYGHKRDHAYGENDVRGNRAYVNLNGVDQFFDSADQAVDKGVLTAIRNTKIVGGDIFAKRAIARSQADNLANLSGDVQVAADYRFFTENRELVNQLIHAGYSEEAMSPTEKGFYEDPANKARINKIHLGGLASLTPEEHTFYTNNKGTIDRIIVALENQSLANPWMITLHRATTELNLDKFAASDFYGGLRGFMDSFDLSDRNTGYESIDFIWEGGPVRVRANGGTNLDGIFTIMAASQNGGRDVVIDDFFGSGLGFNVWHSAVEGNNYLDERHAGHSIVTSGYNPGDDIVIGGMAPDELRGDSGWDWLDGRQGDDRIYGGADNDVLLGRAGSDGLFGQAGDDYLFGGVDNDTWSVAGGGLFGGAGNDIIVGAGGSDDMDGGEGDDTFIIDQDGGGTWDWMYGRNGSDTISYERFVAVEGQTVVQGWPHLRGRLPTSYNGVAIRLDSHHTFPWEQDGRLIYGDGMSSIENVTGSRHNDYLWGDHVNNVLKGGAGEDTLDGAGGDDTLEGGAGADFLFGWVGQDTLSYAGSKAGVFVSLRTNEAFGGDAEGDTWGEMENVRGSRFADELTGLGSASIVSHLYGEGGDDWFNWSGGNDWFFGGEGFDTVDYSQSGGPIYINLNGATQSGDWAGSNSRYDSIESFIGSRFNDAIVGRLGEIDETFAGGAGNDYLCGYGGSDTYVFGLGDGFDTIEDTKDKHNVLRLGEGVTFTNLVMWTPSTYNEQANGSLELQIVGTSDRVSVLRNFEAWDDTVIKVLDLNGAAQLDMGKVRWLTQGTGGADVRDRVETGGGYKDRTELFMGYDGNDVFDGRGGAKDGRAGDILIGGLGNDRYQTGVGADQFAFERGHGRDTINDLGGEDTIVFGPTVAAEDVIYEVVGYDLYIGLRETPTSTLTASQVSNYIRIEGGAPVINVHYDQAGTEIGRSAPTAPGLEFVIAGGASIDLRKLKLPATERAHRPPPGDYHIPPIIFDLGGDGLTISEVSSSDIVARNSSGGVIRMSWAGPEDGFLAFDRNGDGQINRLSEIRFTQDKAGAQTDLEGLRAWDTNADGKLDSKDKDWGKLQIWVDENQNGRSTKKELRSLEEAGITFIDLKGKATGYNRDLTAHSFVSYEITFGRKDGTTGTAYDTALAQRWLHSIDTETGRDNPKFGKPTEDFELGTLLNDPRGEELLEKEKKDKKPLKAGEALDYDAVLGRAQFDFTDHDKEKPKKLAAEAPKSTQATGPEPDYSDPVFAAQLTGLKGPELYGRGGVEEKRRVLPLVFDLDGDGADLIAPEDSSVLHDVDHDGVADRIGWVGADDAILALDRNGDGAIQLTSEISFVSDLPGAKSDLEGLAAFDDNGDGVLNAADSAFARFVLWRDLNGDGVSDGDELIGLAEAGFTELALTAQDKVRDNRDLGSNQVLGRTTATLGAVTPDVLASELPVPVANEAAGREAGTRSSGASSAQDGTSVGARLARAVGAFGADGSAIGERLVERKDVTSALKAAALVSKDGELAEASGAGEASQARPSAVPLSRRSGEGESADSTMPIFSPEQAPAAELQPGEELAEASVVVGATSRTVNVYDVAFGVADGAEAEPSAPVALEEAAAPGLSEHALFGDGGFHGMSLSSFDQDVRRPAALADGSEAPLSGAGLDSADFGQGGTEDTGTVVADAARAVLDRTDLSAAETLRRQATAGAGRGWWREGLGEAPAGLGQRLSSAIGAVRGDRAGELDAGALQQAQLLRQNLAAFGGKGAAGSAVWRRAGESSADEALAASGASIRTELTLRSQAARASLHHL